MATTGAHLIPKRLILFSKFWLRLKPVPPVSLRTIFSCEVVALQEVELMRALGFHKHILQLIGYTKTASGPALIMEYCAEGDLLRFLREKVSGPLVHFLRPQQER